MNIEDSCISCIDTDWSYQLARRMEKEKTNPVLGYRTAGSAAETATGDMLYREMKAIGLTDVTRDTRSRHGGAGAGHAGQGASVVCTVRSA